MAVQEADDYVQDFPKFHQRLLQEFPAQHGLPHRVLSQLTGVGTQLSVDGLSQLISDWCPLKDKEGLPAGWSYRLFRHALSLIRGAAIYLFSRGENRWGFILAEEGGLVTWKREPAYMREIIAKETR